MKSEKNVRSKGNIHQKRARIFLWNTTKTKLYQTNNENESFVQEVRETFIFKSIILPLRLHLPELSQPFTLCDMAIIDGSV